MECGEGGGDAGPVQGGGGGVGRGHPGGGEGVRERLQPML